MVLELAGFLHIHLLFCHFVMYCIILGVVSLPTPAVLLNLLWIFLV